MAKALPQAVLDVISVPAVEVPPAEPPVVVDVPVVPPPPPPPVLTQDEQQVPAVDIFNKRLHVTNTLLLDLGLKHNISLGTIVAGLLARGQELTDMQYGALLRIGRKKANMTLQETADLLHVDSSTLGYWERGVNQVNAKRSKEFAVLFPELQKIESPGQTFAIRAARIVDNLPVADDVPVVLDTPAEERSSAPKEENMNHIQPLPPPPPPPAPTLKPGEPTAEFTKEKMLQVITLAVRARTNGEALLNLLELVSATNVTVAELRLALNL